ncbi:hypothetical protein A3735_27140 [Oleiphilus sp. HI0061]|uniref:hypothetical protein n=1 Tax=Oleiphilus sp. HI0061 TaxID=1822239 RepID=UPI0007CF31AE|nr:hypothetical protein [Oleiphilus sp. HI0061]KZY62514.1 hypothetical protein A3735_27185 [Oleiphilus sp. HI0061]KZY62531.1 hypothetical protein A3735_27140 [Oleiphilus sp. HI0061]
MKIRMMGADDLNQRLVDFLVCQRLHDGRVYPNRGGNGSRVYLDIDDREAERILEKLERFNQFLDDEKSFYVDQILENKNNKLR